MVLSLGRGGQVDGAYVSPVVVRGVLMTVLLGAERAVSRSPGLFRAVSLKTVARLIPHA